MADEQSQHLSLGVPRETFPGESRVAVTPGVLAALSKAGIDVVVESGAGEAAGYLDDAYLEKGAKVGSRADAFAADIVCQVRTLGANPEKGNADLKAMRPGQVVIGLANPLAAPDAAQQLATRKVTAFGMELVPRITRAQSMDVLSSQASIGGYKAVLVAANALPKMLPMMTTAAGTIPPARVFIMGAGVAGLQAIATARRLGAVVEAFDVRAEVKEQIQSLGGKFVEVPLDTEEAKGTGGYAKEQSEEFLKKQRELMAKVVAGSDIVITTAQVPGKKAPVLVTDEMVAGMQPGSVIVDMAAGQGGNVEPSKPDEVVVAHGVTILGPTNLPSTVAFHASQTYSKNIATFVAHLFKGGSLELDTEDEIIRETMLTRDGDVVHPKLREALGLAAPAAAPATPQVATPGAPGTDGTGTTDEKGAAVTEGKAG